jgi:ketosteroid isomerase-like protein
MSHLRTTLLLLLAATGLLYSCSPTKPDGYQLTKNYKPDDQALYDTIMRLDSVFFGAYNTCERNFEQYASFYSDSIEFYHDQGGLATSREAILQSTKQYVCGKVERQLVAGSIEVYPIKGYGAIEMGLHRFHNRVEGSTGRVGRFVIIWRKEAGGWKITRVVSLH